ncbi:MAG: hypothetical protein A3E37_04005 [Candidatus Andersenbacteria bacterium RIFCSPHIGHO2_12_FULL_46_9]|nr:MAG: hypothetical protein UW94_C0016G0005 [Parcubacteria group bacterium GW2011_GWA2_45_14]OGY33942.1 MAG: hypothetical protein A3B76_02070 [Candidatus Andersenbacteria bacterium RIFCSPHIGHO2_02_FULL_46_16]OGY35993.1 MAG: hypothetical protein A3E37_04005 [Candidatus Andersenbacteria bacterium RIFCSPHIGHO2_12_FULL_46_9]OGY38486.1 MAG: hypothetical protein A3I08_00510 [Candidatus Andersenbacteria bacterium RIFCSPLOWO2_02_FULL_46_11]HBE90258.1 hypothetical protein [Candidatus Andersenbacteria b
MATSKRDRLINANAEKAALLAERNIPHSPLLGESANNAAHRRQRDEYDRLLGNVPSEEEDPDEENHDQPTPSPVDPRPVDPPTNPSDPVDKPSGKVDNSTTENEADDTSPKPILVISNRRETSSNPAPFPASPTSDTEREARQALKEAQDMNTEANSLINELQQQLVNQETKDKELAILRKKIADYQVSEKAAVEKQHVLQKEQADLKKQIVGHQLPDDPKQVVCLLRKDHDQKFVERTTQINPWWRWACLICGAALLVTVIWLIVIGIRSTNTAETPDKGGLKMNFPTLRELK